MLNPERIPIGKLKQAYGLNERDIQRLLSALPPDGTFPDTLWRNAYKSFWFGPLESYLSGYRIGTLFKPSKLDFLLFPEIAIQHDDYFYISKLEEQIIVLFMSLSGILISNILQDGINYIFEEIYDDCNDIFRNEREILFNKISEEDKNYDIKFRTCENISQLLETMDWKRHAIPHKYFTFLSSVFIDSIIVNKSAAVRYIFECGYPLRREVKGISKAILERITASVAQNAPVHDIVSSADLPSTPELPPIFVPSELWQGKTPQAVRDGMKQEGYADPVIAHVLFTWCKLKNKKRIGILLGDNPDQDESAHRRRANNLLDEARTLTISSA
ncbi:MAG: hypothetical protein LBD42_09450 [Desulfovibrio sp.]|jgi:hypothetical protein|nr:hypothetical protein [Desulfovibrio sp.]